MNPTDATVLWLDCGLFVDFAIRYAPGFKRTLYFTPWVNSFPKSNAMMIGDGFDEIERVNYFWDHIDEVDLVICPDVYFFGRAGPTGAHGQARLRCPPWR